MNLASLSLASPSLFSTTSIVLPAITVTQRLVEIVKTYFNMMQWGALWTYGLKEILLDRVRNIDEIQSKPALPTHANRVNAYINRILVKKDSTIGDLKFNIAHGLLYIGSGLMGSVAGLHRLGVFVIGKTVFPLEAAGNSLFGLGSLLALIQNIQIYKLALKVTSNSPLHEREAADMLRKSAVIGIISSLNYIAAAAVLVIGGPATMALIFGVLALFTGCVKILYYDFFRFKDSR